MTRRRLVATLTLILGLSASFTSAQVRIRKIPTAAAEGGENPIDLARRTDWSLAGVTGGIPARAGTPCYTDTGGLDSAATITSQIATCAGAAVPVVKLQCSSTYNLTSGIDFAGNSNVTLRGCGADSTKLVFSDDASCQGRRANVCITGNDLSYYVPDGIGGSTHIATWTAANYNQGQTVATFSSVTGLSTGMWVVLDQTNDTSDTGDVTVCITINVCADEGATDNGRSGRGQRQMVKVTNIAGSVVTFTPGLQMPNWRLAKTPGAFWGTSTGLSSGNGIEDLSVDATNGMASIAAITVMMTTNSWVKGVRVINCPQPEACVLLYLGSHLEVRDSYFYGSVDFSIGFLGYGVETTGVSDSLIENNIVQHRTSPFVSDGDSGSVFGYNYVFDDYYPISAPFMQASQYSHLVGNGMVLHEGNEAVGIKGDIVHGTSNLFTYFRNYSRGWETGKTQETNAVKLYALSRYYNFVGNVLGTDTYHTNYGTAGSDLAIWSFGNASINPPPNADSAALATMLRWGNYDTVNDATRFVSGEVPTGIPVLPNPLPSTHTLVTSMYRSSKPAFFQSQPWPGIGPDVDCADGDCPTGVGLHVVKNPAHKCFDARPADGANAYKTFNRVACYGS